jgi:hypothetical protein
MPNDTTNRFYNSVIQDKEPSEGNLALSSEQDNGKANDSTEEQRDKIGDNSMSHEARQVLVNLMRQGVILNTQKPKLFAVLCRYEAAIRRHLSEVYLQLILDQKTGVAFIQGIDQENADDAADETDNDTNNTETPTLITKRPLSLYDTLLLLILRKFYQERETAGEQTIVIDIDTLESSLIPFLPLTDYQSIERKKLLARLKEFGRRKLLASIRGSEDRYEITPVIRYVVNAEFLESLLTEYQTLAKNLQGQTDQGEAL